MSSVEQTTTPSEDINASADITGFITPEVDLIGEVSIPQKEVIGGEKPKIGEITISTDDWIAEDNFYYQVVDVEGVTNKSQVDLTPDIQQLLIFYEKDLTFVTKNYVSEVTVFAIGQKPLNDYTIQVTLTEVDVPDGSTIWGVTVGTPISPEKLADKLGGISYLPTITEGDNGKVLKAQDGKWTVQDDATAKPLSNLEIEELIRNFK